MNLRISEIAESVGVSSDTIRYYEREGLLPAPARSVSGYRQYDQGITGRLRFIKGAQAFGLKLSEIGELLEIQDKGACPCGHTRALLEKRSAELTAEIERLSLLHEEIQRMARLDCPASVKSELWPCEAQFVKRGGET
ncbi:MAG: MerR family DNA-binding transcriptional regulator [Actinobacteria bacterium]|nr:MerR family DNA-binding transcriptional regulator [Actinomycetota bacterium]